MCCDFGHPKNRRWHTQLNVCEKEEFPVLDTNLRLSRKSSNDLFISFIRARSRSQADLLYCSAIEIKKNQDQTRSDKIELVKRDTVSNTLILNVTPENN